MEMLLPGGGTDHFTMAYRRDTIGRMREIVRRWFQRAGAHGTELLVEGEAGDGLQCGRKTPGTGRGSG